MPSRKSLTLTVLCLGANLAAGRTTPVNVVTGSHAANNPQAIPYSTECITTETSPSVGCVAANAISSLQSAYYDSNSNRGWPDTQPWINANTIEVLSNFLSQADKNLYADLFKEIHQIVEHIFKVSNVGVCRTPTSCGSWDDLAWWGLAWLRYYEVTGAERYLQRSQYIYSYIHNNGWVLSCGQSYQWGNWGQQAYTYQNSIIQELMVTFAMRLAAYPNNGYYDPKELIERSKHLYSWMKSNTIQDSSLIIDGVDAWTCEVNPSGGSAYWTYNSGTLLEGLALLTEHTGDASYVQDALTIADAAIAKFASKEHPGVLVEDCEPSCDGNQVAFKGIFARYLGYLTKYDSVPEDKAASYWQYLDGNMQSLWNAARSQTKVGSNVQNLYDLQWYSTNGLNDPGTQTSAMDVFTQMLYAEKQGVYNATVLEPAPVQSSNSNIFLN